MLIEGGGFLLQKGSGMLLGHAVDGSLSNKHAMNRFISAWVRTMQNKGFIRSE
jgi:hypothetical protein